MNIIDGIYNTITKYRDSGESPRRIMIGEYAAALIEIELGEPVHCLHGLPVEVREEMSPGEVAICSEGCSDLESLRSECPHCQSLSYENGFCHGCGIYRGDEEDAEEDDLIDLISDQGEALEYGFSLMEEE